MLTEQDEQLWAGLTEAARAQLTAVATSFLLDRELLRRPDQDGSVMPGTVNGIAATQSAQVMDLPMAPPLALIITARQGVARWAGGGRGPMMKECASAPCAGRTSTPEPDAGRPDVWQQLAADHPDRQGQQAHLQQRHVLQEDGGYRAGQGDHRGGEPGREWPSSPRPYMRGVPAVLPSGRVSAATTGTSGRRSSAARGRPTVQRIGVVTDRQAIKTMIRYSHHGRKPTPLGNCYASPTVSAGRHSRRAPFAGMWANGHPRYVHAGAGMLAVAAAWIR